MLSEFAINLFVSVILLTFGYLGGKYRERRWQQGRQLEEYDFYPFALDDQNILHFDLAKFSTGIRYLLGHGDAFAARQLIFIGEQNDVANSLQGDDRDQYRKLYKKIDGDRILDDNTKFLENYKRIVRLIGDSFPDTGIEILLHSLSNPAKALYQIKPARLVNLRSVRRGETVSHSGDVIVFAPSNKYEPGPLRRVAAVGGESQPLTATEPGESHENPVFLTDAEHFLYTSLGGREPGIYLASLDDPSGRRLLPDESSAKFAPSPVAGVAAHLLFMRDGDLMAHPFDTERLELSGQPFLLLEGVQVSDFGAPAVSVSDNGVLTYTGGTSREIHSRFSWFDRDGNVLSRVERPAGPAVPASLSPGEDAVAVHRRAPGRSESELYLLDLSPGGLERRFIDLNTITIDVAGNPVWGPDGGRVVFSARGEGAFDLYWRGIGSTGVAQPLLETQLPKYATDWSRHGYLLYTELNPQTQADMWYIPLEVDEDSGGIRGGDPVELLVTEDLESAGQLSPDGRWFAYVSDESEVREVYVRAFPSGAGKQLVSGGGGQQPRWSQDGGELFFFSGTTSRPTLMSAAVREGGTDSPGDRVRFAADPAEPLFETVINSFHPATGTFFFAVSEDGQRFLVNHREGPGEPVLNVVVNWRRAFGVARDLR